MRVTHKLGAGYGLMLLLLFAAAGAGLSAAGRLGDAIDFLAGPAWDTADGAMESTILLERQMLWIEQSMSAQQISPDLDALIQKGDSTFNRMFEAGLISADLKGQVVAAQHGFTVGRSDLLTALSAFAEQRTQLDQMHDRLLVFMRQLEEMGNDAMATLEGRGAVLEEELSPLWNAADGAMEARIALLNHVHQFEQLVDRRLSLDEQQPLLAAALDKLKQQAQRLEGLAPFAAPISAGEFAGMPAAQALTQLMGDYEQQTTAALAAYGRYATARQHYSQQAAELLRLLIETEDAGDHAVEGETDRIAATKRFALFAILGTVALGLLVGLGAIGVVMRTVAAPLVRISERLRDIAEGEGDLSVRLETRGSDELAELARFFNLFVEKIAATIRQVTHSAGEVAMAADALAHVAVTTRDTVERESAQTEQAATAMNEMAATVQEVAGSAGRAAQAAQEANEIGRQGRGVIESTVAAIDTLAEGLAEAGRVVENLEQRSGSINAITDVIRGIAEQTNLLALNAAIEAARAGEQGRGFAVVADEVRTLAGRTHQSTQEIATMLRELQGESQAAAGAMRESRERASASVRTVGEAGEALERIAAAIDLISEMNTQIAGASEEQRTVAEEMNRNLNGIADLSGQIADGAQQTAVSSQQLTRLAEALRQLVGQFRT